MKREEKRWHVQNAIDALLNIQYDIEFYEWMRVTPEEIEDLKRILTTTQAMIDTLPERTDK